MNRITLSHAAPAALLLAFATGVQAGSPSSFAESRGYQGCVDAAKARPDVDLIRVDADYFVYEHADSRRLYLNGYAFHGSDSEAVKISCETTLSGARVLDVAVDAGRYAGRFVDPVDVAKN